MKHFLLLVSTFFYLGTLLHAGPVPEHIARQAGAAFLTSGPRAVFFNKQVAFSAVRYMSEEGLVAHAPDAAPYFYLFGLDDKGFVMVSGDDRITPIIGYSYESRLVDKNMPAHIADWLKMYKEEIREALDILPEPTEEVAHQWASLLAGQYPGDALREGSTVDPLIKAKWDQSPHYNALAPFDNQANQRTVAGCVATAMAMVLHYWKYPANGTGFYSYNHQKYGTLSANFGATSYDYNSMPNVVNSPNNAVATLMYHCGISVKMDFGIAATGGSSAYLIYDKSPITECSEHAFKTYFGFKQSSKGEARDNYTQSQWINLLKTELDASRPILYGGIGQGGGHAFICDGYDNNNFFHMNWGWSGNFDGYFTVNALNPSGVGTGGGTGGFNYHQQIIAGLEPIGGADPDPGPQSHDLRIFAQITSSSNPLQYGQPFSVSTNFGNFGNNDFTGDFAAAVFNESLTFIDFIEVKTGMSLPAQNAYQNNQVFSTQAMFSMVPGTYYIAFFYRPVGGDWVIVNENGPLVNFIERLVFFQNDIEMNSEMITNPFPSFRQGQSATVNLNVLNNSNFTFTGEYVVAMYDLQGDFVETINSLNENNGLPPGFTYLSPFLTFSSPNLQAGPGTYLLATLFRPTGSNQYFLVGSLDYPNPILINVEAPGLQPDQYEPNNTAAQAFTLPVSFSGNTANFKTSGANLHVGNDYDYYRVNLPAGFDYSINTRLQDAWSSSDGQSYTCDAVFVMSTDGGASWSPSYDDVMPAPVQISNGGTVLFHIASFFVGETGTYALQMNIQRSMTSSLNQPGLSAMMQVFPNPASDQVQIVVEGFEGSLQSISLHNLHGQIVRHQPLSPEQRSLLLQTSDLPAGIYVLQVATDAGIVTRKIELQR
jgi:hypothetical protein